jgi:hypothetical protein
MDTDNNAPKQWTGITQVTEQPSLRAINSLGPAFNFFLLVKSRVGDHGYTGANHSREK